MDKRNSVRKILAVSVAAAGLLAGSTSVFASIPSNQNSGSKTGEVTTISQTTRTLPPVLVLQNSNATTQLVAQQHGSHASHSSHSSHASHSSHSSGL
jgi:hypothetical protein